MISIEEVYGMVRIGQWTFAQFEEWAYDLKQTWDECNEDPEADPEMVVDKLFGGMGCSSQLEMWDDEMVDELEE